MSSVEDRRDGSAMVVVEKTIDRRNSQERGRLELRKVRLFSPSSGDCTSVNGNARWNVWKKEMNGACSILSMGMLAIYILSAADTYLLYQLALNKRDLQALRWFAQDKCFAQNSD